MCRLRVIGTGSSGNSYALMDGRGRILLLDLGLSVKEIQRGIDYRISDVVGAVVTHKHKDHARSIDEFRKTGIYIFAPYDTKHISYEIESIPIRWERFWDYAVKSFDLTDKNGRFVHTDADGTECPCYGFKIEHPFMGTLVYITDAEFCKWRFSRVNHILISCNYMKKYLSSDEAKRNHVLRGHMELETVKDFVKANKSDALRSVILCHMSKDNAEPIEMVEEVKKVAGNGVYVDYARAGLEVELMGHGVLPF